MESITYIPTSAVQVQHANTDPASAMNLLYLILILLPAYIGFLASYFRRNDVQINTIMAIACSCIGFGVLTRCTVSFFDVRFEDIVYSLRSWYVNNQKSNATANTTLCVLLLALLGYVSVCRYAYELVESYAPPLLDTMEPLLSLRSLEVDGSFKDRLECV